MSNIKNTIKLTFKKYFSKCMILYFLKCRIYTILHIYILSLKYPYLSLNNIIILKYVKNNIKS